MSRNTGETSGSAPKPPSRTRAPRRGPVRRSLEAALAGVTLTGEALVFAELARQAATVVDEEIRDKNRPGILRAGKELRELVDLLPIRSTGEGAPDDRDRDPRGRVLELLDSPAALGHRT